MSNAPDYTPTNYTPPDPTSLIGRQLPDQPRRVIRIWAFVLNRQRITAEMCGWRDHKHPYSRFHN